MIRKLTLESGSREGECARHKSKVGRKRVCCRALIRSERNFYFWKEVQPRRLRNGKGRRAQVVGEAVHVCRERKGASNSEEKKRMGNVMILGRHRV